MTDEEFARIYQGHDYEMFDEEGKLTVGTMFIDAVQMKIARSSTAPMNKRYTLEMATHSSILTWKIPWTEELGGPQSTELQRVRHD